MRIGIDLDVKPFSKQPHAGPHVFMSRLAESIKTQNLAQVSSLCNPFRDVTLFNLHTKRCFRKNPFVLRVDGIYFDSKNTLGDTDAFNAPKFRSIDEATGLIFISDFCRKLVERFHKKIDKPYCVVHNSVDRRRFTPRGDNMRAALGFSENDTVFITAAHWRRHKRLKEIITLFNRVRDSREGVYKLLVLGGDPDFLVEDPDIHYIGEIVPHELPPWYRTADVYVHLAWLEPCGNTQIEAIASGVPIVCPNNGGICETVNQANAGIVSHCDDVFNFERVDLYNPPEPDYDVLLSDVLTVLDNKDEYVSRIQYDAIDIRNAAERYVNFIKSVVRG